MAENENKKSAEFNGRMKFKARKLPQEEAEKYWCENCCNYNRESEGPDGCALCKMTGIQTFGQMFGGDCCGFNIPYEFIGDIRKKNEAPCDIKLIIKEDFPFGMSLRSEEYIGSTIGLKFTYLGRQYGTVRYLPTPKVTAADLKRDLPDMIRDVITFPFIDNTNS